VNNPPVRHQSDEELWERLDDKVMWLVCPGVEPLPQGFSFAVLSAHTLREALHHAWNKRHATPIVKTLDDVVIEHQQNYRLCERLGFKEP
jgi:hypothetical protein